MRLNKNRLFEIVSRFASLKALVVGDIILDRYVWGRVDRISPEAPVPIVSVQSNEDRLGGAANAANNFSTLGIRTELIGAVGKDQEREALHILLRSANILGDQIITDPNRPTTLKTRVMGQRQQLLRIDRESNAPLELDEELFVAAHEKLLSSDLMLVSDYGKGALTRNFFAKISKEIENIGPRAPIVALDPHPANYAYYRNFDVAKPNRKEAEAASGIKILNPATAATAAEKLRNLWGCRCVIVSLSEEGLVACSQDGSFHLPTIVRDVFDVSGAGDTLTAVVAASLATGANAVEATTLGIIASSNVVGKLGTATISADELNHDIELLSSENKIPLVTPLNSALPSEMVR